MFFFVHQSSVRQGEINLDAVYGIWVAEIGVAIEHHEVGFLSGLQSANCGFQDPSALRPGESIAPLSSGKVSIG